MFIYVTDTNKQTWAINVNKVSKVAEDNNSTLIYFNNGDIFNKNISDNVYTLIMKFLPKYL